MRLWENHSLQNKNTGPRGFEPRSPGPKPDALSIELWARNILMHKVFKKPFPYIIIIGKSLIYT